MEQRLTALWYRESAGFSMLAPLGWLYGWVMALRRAAYAIGLLEVHRAGKPVIVVGNLTVGGTGKTPLVAWLAQQLALTGLRVGIVSRGYGRSGTAPQSVHAESSWREVGDEPMLLASLTGCDVVVARDRVAGAQRLVALGVDVIIADDGLQHLRLARDCEIVVIDGARGFGNGRLLPAGPLREPASRLRKASLIVVNGTPEHASVRAGVEGSLQMSLFGGEAHRVDGLAAPEPLEHFRGRRVHAVAGIGHPQRFFRNDRRDGGRSRGDRSRGGRGEGRQDQSGRGEQGQREAGGVDRNAARGEASGFDRNAPRGDQGSRGEAGGFDRNGPRGDQGSRSESGGLDRNQGRGESSGPVRGADQGQRGDAGATGRADQGGSFDQNGRNDRGGNVDRGDPAQADAGFPPDDIGNRIEGADANGNGPNGDRPERGGERRSRRGRRRGRRGGGGRGEGGNREGGSPAGGLSEGSGSEDSFASQAAPVSQANGYQHGGGEGQHHGGGEGGGQGGFESPQRDVSSAPREASQGSREGSWQPREPSQAREAGGGQQSRESAPQAREPSLPREAAGQFREPQSPSEFRAPPPPPQQSGSGDSSGGDESRSEQAESKPEPAHLEPPARPAPAPASGGESSSGGSAKPFVVWSSAPSRDSGRDRE